MFSIIAVIAGAAAETSSHPRLIIAQTIDDEHHSLVFIINNPTRQILAVTPLFSQNNSITLLPLENSAHAVRLGTSDKSSEICALSSELTFWTRKASLLCGSQPSFFYLEWSLWNMDQHLVSSPTYFINGDGSPGGRLPPGERIAIAGDMDHGPLAFRLIMFNETDREITLPPVGSSGNQLELELPENKKYSIRPAIDTSITLQPGEMHFENVDVAKLLADNDDFNPDDFACGLAELTWTLQWADGETLSARVWLVKFNGGQPPENKFGYGADLPIRKAFAEPGFTPSDCAAISPAPVEDGAMANRITDAANTLFRPRLIAPAVAMCGNPVVILGAAAYRQQAPNPELEQAMSLFSIETAAKLNSNAKGFSKEWRPIVRAVMENISTEREAYAVWVRCWEIFRANDTFAWSDLWIMPMIGRISDVEFFIPLPADINSLRKKIRTINDFRAGAETKAEMVVMGIEILKLFTER